MAVYYCTDSQITTLLPATLTGTDLATEGARNTLLRAPAKSWVDSVYPNWGPFPAASAASGYKVNQTGHAAGGLAVTVDGGTGNPAAGDFFQIDGHNSWYKVTAYAANVVSYTWVTSYRSGVETTTAGARAEFLNDSEIEFGPSILIQQAATWWARALAYQILRNTPEAPEAKMAFAQAKQVLQLDRFGLARARPQLYRGDALDATREDDPWSSMYVHLER
uniref:Tail protein n=1 Tax=viral metagenome TaxID=1070528 RepID=A0A6M3LAB5_9ZZZZ